MKEGTINGLVTNFETAFGGTFAKEYHEITDILKETQVNIGGFELNITYHEENIEIEFPQIGCVYTHMLGHDCHSIVAGACHANVIIEQLKGYKAKVKSKYPEYSGLNYLDMTAGFFFPQN